MFKWKNYDDPDDNTWEPADNLKEAEAIIKKYEKVVHYLRLIYLVNIVD